MTLHYSAQRYGTWEWLDLDLPFTTDGPEWALSTYGIMECTIAPELGIQTAFDDRLLLEEWGTLIHVETDDDVDKRRWTGIVTESFLDGNTWKVTVYEFPGYLSGTPVEKKVWGVLEPASNIFRQVWADVQSFYNADLGVQISGTINKLLGSTSEDRAEKLKKELDLQKKVVQKKDKAAKAKVKEQQALAKEMGRELDALRKIVTTEQKVVKALRAELTTLRKNKASKASIKAKETQIKNAEVVVKNKRLDVDWYQNPMHPRQHEKFVMQGLVDIAREQVEQARLDQEQIQNAYTLAREDVQEDGGAYKILPEDFTDAHEAIMDLCEHASFEWSTETKFSDGAPDLTIHLAPRVGSKREDLVFEQGTNVMSVLQLVRGRDYANAASGIGSGEGRKAIRKKIENTSNRLRRVATVEDRKIKTADELDSRMRAELSVRTGQPFVEEIEVIDHDLAPMFSWKVGDDILVQGEVPHYGEYSAYHRILSWQMKGEHRAVLRLELTTA